MTERLNVSLYLFSLRFDPKHHLGLGDIRLTIAQQNEIIQAWAEQNRLIQEQERLLNKIKTELKDYPKLPISIRLVEEITK